jgi:hypothetical protein
MRVAPATLIYPIGTVLRFESLSEISKNCSYAPLSPLEPIDGPRVPSMTATRTIESGADPGSFISRGIKEISAANVKYERIGKLTATISNVSTQLLAEDQLDSVLNEPTCLSSVEGKRVSVIRGYISACYNVSAGGGVYTGLKASVHDTDLLKIRYKDENNFEIKEKQPSEKFVILANGVANSGLQVSVRFFKSLSDPKEALKYCKVVSRVIYDPQPQNSEVDLHSLFMGGFRTCEDYRARLDELNKKDPIFLSKHINSVLYGDSEFVKLEDWDRRQFRIGEPLISEDPY